MEFTLFSKCVLCYLQSQLHYTVIILKQRQNQILYGYGSLSTYVCKHLSINRLINVKLRQMGLSFWDKFLCARQQLNINNLNEKNKNRKINIQLVQTHNSVDQ
jgi:hypothetical protein